MNGEKEEEEEGGGGGGVGGVKEEGWGLCVSSGDCAGENPKVELNGEEEEMFDRFVR